jgi:hypothetical protein
MMGSRIPEKDKNVFRDTEMQSSRESRYETQTYTSYLAPHYFSLPRLFKVAA